MYNCVKSENAMKRIVQLNSLVWPQPDTPLYDNGVEHARGEKLIVIQGEYSNN